MTPLRSTVFASLRAANRFTPSSASNRWRAWSLTHARHALPRELMIRGGDCVVQVGMNNTENIQRLSRCVGSRGRVFLIEGDAQNVQKIRGLIVQRKLSNVEVIHSGAWSERTKLRFKIAEYSDDHRIDRDGVSMPQEMSRDIYTDTRVFEVDTLDRLLAGRGIESVDYLEVTVNGAELEVLRGAESTLMRTQRIFTAGRARLADGSPINRPICEFLEERCFQTIVTLASPSARTSFGAAHGDVFAWRSDR